MYHFVGQKAKAVIDDVVWVYHFSDLMKVYWTLSTIQSSQDRFK